MISIRFISCGLIIIDFMLKLICTSVFHLSGWKYVNRIPEDIKSYVFIGAPHTSNHDILPTMVISHKLKGNVRFVIKNQWLKFPMGILFRHLGAIGVDREKIHSGATKNTTELIASLFSQIPELVLMIAPEGTRKPTRRWKSGFYHIALKAGVPIVLGYVDYQKKETGLGKVIYPTEYETDMRTIVDFYKNIHGKNPENFLLPDLEHISECKS